MKKFIFSLIFAFTATIINAMTVNEFVSRYDKGKDVEVVHLNKLTLTTMSVKEKNLKDIDDIKVLSIEEMSKEKKDSILKDISALKVQKDYDLTVKNDGSYVFIKMTGDKVTEVLVVNMEEDSNECQIVAVKGDLKLDKNNNITGVHIGSKD